MRVHVLGTLFHAWLVALEDAARGAWLGHVSEGVHCLISVQHYRHIPHPHTHMCTSLN